MLITLGATHLDCYEGPLSQLYERNGFDPVKRIPWDSRYAHPQWVEAEYGTPDVIEMKLRRDLCMTQNSMA